MLDVFENFNPENIERQERALESLNSNSYIQKQKPEDLEEFFIKMIKKILIDKETNFSRLKSSLSNVVYFIFF